MDGIMFSAWLDDAGKIMIGSERGRDITIDVARFVRKLFKKT